MSNIISWRQDFLRRRETGGIDVPCHKGCVACCKAFSVQLHPHEVGDYPAKDLVLDKQKLVAFKRQSDGACVYLVNNKCSIYERRPRGCREFDCRMYAWTNITPQGAPGLQDAAKRWNLSADTFEDQILWHAIIGSTEYAHEHKGEDVDGDWRHGGFIEPTAEGVAEWAIRNAGSLVPHLRPFFLGERAKGNMRSPKYGGLSPCAVDSYKFTETYAAHWFIQDYLEKHRDKSGPRAAETRTA